MAQSPFKFDRNYNLQIEVNPSAAGTLPFSPLPLTITLPLTLEFDITRKDYSKSGVGNFTIYNLSETHRRLIAHDEFDQQTFQGIILKAGYGNGDLPTIFKGNITRCVSERRGVDFVTTIEAWDGGEALNTATFNEPFPAGTPLKTVITSMCASLSEFNVSIGAIGNFENLQSPLLGNMYSGDTLSLLDELTGFGTFIENEIIHCIKDDEHIIVPDVPLINSQSGLLGTPLRQQSFIQFDVIFEPRARMGALINLQSTTGTATGFSNQQNYNGFYKVSNLHHRGTISEVKCGELITTIGVPATPGGSTGITPLTFL